MAKKADARLPFETRLKMRDTFNMILETPRFFHQFPHIADALENVVATALLHIDEQLKAAMLAAKFNAFLDAPALLHDLKALQRLLQDAVVLCCARFIIPSTLRNCQGISQELEARFILAFGLSFADDKFGRELYSRLGTAKYHVFNAKVQLKIENQSRKSKKIMRSRYKKYAKQAGATTDAEAPDEDWVLLATQPASSSSACASGPAQPQRLPPGLPDAMQDTAVPGGSPERISAVQIAMIELAVRRQGFEQSMVDEIIADAIHLSSVLPS